jgi:hypothetical protein
MSAHPPIATEYRASWEVRFGPASRTANRTVIRRSLEEAKAAFKAAFLRMEGRRAGKAPFNARLPSVVIENSSCTGRFTLEVL